MKLFFLLSLYKSVVFTEGVHEGGHRVMVHGCKPKRTTENYSGKLFENLERH